MKKLLLSYLLILSSCVVKEPDVSPGEVSSDQSYAEDLITLHVSVDGTGSTLSGGDLSDDGNVLVFSDSVGGSAPLFYRKDLSSDQAPVVESSVAFLNSRFGSGDWSLSGHNGGSGTGMSNFRIDDAADFSYFTVNNHTENRKILYRKRVGQDPDEILTHVTENISKASISKTGQHIVFSSSLINPSTLEITGSGVTNLFKYNSHLDELVPITERVAATGFQALNASISNDGDTVLYTALDLEDNFVQPTVGSGRRAALVYHRLFDDKKFVLNPEHTFTLKYLDPDSYKISEDGRHAAFRNRIKNSKVEEIWHYDSTLGAFGVMNLVVRKLSFVQGNLNLCDISPDGKLVAFTSRDMGLIGQKRSSPTPQLFMKNMYTNKVHLISHLSAQRSNQELAGSVISCDFTEEGSSIIFVHERLDGRRQILKKNLK